MNEISNAENISNLVYKNILLWQLQPVPKHWKGLMYTKAMTDDGDLKPGLGQCSFHRPYTCYASPERDFTVRACGLKPHVQSLFSEFDNSSRFSQAYVAFVQDDSLTPRKSTLSEKRQFSDGRKLLQGKTDSGDREYHLPSPNASWAVFAACWFCSCFKSTLLSLCPSDTFPLRSGLLQALEKFWALNCWDFTASLIINFRASHWIVAEINGRSI